MNELCELCCRDCKDDYSKIDNDGAYCYDWLIAIEVPETYKAEEKEGEIDWKNVRGCF